MSEALRDLVYLLCIIAIVLSGAAFLIFLYEIGSLPNTAWSALFSLAFLVSLTVIGTLMAEKALLK